MILHRVWLAIAAILTGGYSVNAMADEGKIQDVVTQGGYHAWLIENHAAPMISVEISFRAGAAFEPKDKEGVATFTASLLDEGAGPYAAKEYRDELEKIGARLSGSASSVDLDVNLMTLSEHKERAFELLGMAIRQPRFEDEAVARIRDALLAGIRRGDEEPSVVAWRKFRPLVYGDHPYANSGEGTLKTVGALTAADAKAWHDTQLTKQNMVISVVGDIDAATLAGLLDKALAGLPEGTLRNAVKDEPKPVKAVVQTAKMDVPQGTVLMGQLGLTREDPDYYPLLVMNEILGGGVLTSRLGLDVREVHGLVYDVRSVNSPLPKGSMFYVSLASDNTKVEKALELVRKHLNGMREKEVTEEEFNDAKAYLIGSFPLRLDSNAKLLAMLTLMQSEGLGMDYMQEWPKRIAAVKREDTLRVAKRLLHPDKMVLVVVGNGPALEAK